MKKFLSALICVSLLSSVAPVALAVSDHPVPIDGSDSENIPMTIDATYSGSGLLEATEEDMAYWALHQKESRPSDDISPLASSWMPLDPFTYYKQNTNNTCTIACTRMALKYVTGSAPSETTIKAVTGAPCSIASAVDYFNDYTSKYQYAAKYNATKRSMKNDLYNCISDGAPPILGIHMTTTDGWPYNLDCHAVAAYSVRSDKSEFALCDPWAGYKGQKEWQWYDKSADDLYAAYDAVNAGYMY